MVLLKAMTREKMDTSKDVESMLGFLCGCSVPFNDAALMLDRFKGGNSDHLPCPLLVKLSTVRHKRPILAAKCNLKDFGIKKVRISQQKLKAHREKRIATPNSLV